MNRENMRIRVGFSRFARTRSVSVAVQMLEMAARICDGVDLSGGAAVVVPQQSAQSFAAIDDGNRLCITFVRFDFVGLDQCVVETLMVPFGMVVFLKLFECPPQRALAEEDQSVEAFGFQG